MEDQPTQHCRNCYHPLPPGANFCPQCSQKNTDGRFTFRELLARFADTIFNFDARIFQTLRDLAVPGKLTEQFFQGKHVRYYHPVRLFVVTGAVMIAVISIVVSRYDISQADMLWKNIEQSHQRKALLAEVDSLGQSIAATWPDSTAAGAAFDTLNQRLLNMPQGLYVDSLSVLTFIQVGTATSGIQMATEDILTLSTDSLANKYGVEGLWDRLILAQNLRILRSPSSFFLYLIGNILWMALVMMPMLALVLKLVYFRQPFFYYEHLIFSFHIHTFFFLATILAVPVVQWIGGWALLAVLLVSGLYPLFATKRFYGQNWRNTIFKNIIVSILYLFIFIAALAFTSFVSIFLF